MLPFTAKRCFKSQKSSSLNKEARDGKTDAGNPHVRFDEGEATSVPPLLYRYIYVNVFLAQSTQS
jgi:hypothetical protein